MNTRATRTVLYSAGSATHHPGPAKQQPGTLRCSFSPGYEGGGSYPCPRSQKVEAAEAQGMGPFPPHLRNVVCLQKKLGLVSISTIPTQAGVDA